MRLYVVLGPGKGNQANLKYATQYSDMQNVCKNRNLQNMMHMQNIQNNMCKICKECANEYAEQVNKYVKIMQNMQNMQNHFPICRVCKD